MITVHLLRHGEVYNPQRILYGRMPGFGLSELGLAQAKLAAEFLVDRNVGYLASSPLERAQQTLQPLADSLGLDAVVDERLTEAANVLEGRQVAGGKGLFRDPATFKHYRNPFRPSWGEPYTQIAARMLGAVRAARNGALAAGAQHEAVCVSHQLPIEILRRHVEGRRLFHDPRHRLCALASVTSLTFAGDAIVRVEYAEPAASLPSGHGSGA